MYEVSLFFIRPQVMMTIGICHDVDSSPVYCLRRVRTLHIGILSICFTSRP